MYQSYNGRIDDNERRELIIRALDEVRAECAKIGLRETVREIDVIKRFNIPQATARDIIILTAKAIGGLQEEAIKNDFFKIDFQDRGFYEGEPLSDGAASAFPSATVELKRAGKCYAVDQTTACVFHSMRALEGGLCALADAIGVRLPLPNQFAEWQTLISGCERKIKDMQNLPKGESKSKDLTFYFKTACQMHYFEDAWRNYVMHGRASYDKSSAKEVMEHVRLFLEYLAERMTERFYNSAQAVGQ